MTKLYLIAPLKKDLLEGNPASLLYLKEWVGRYSNIPVEIINDIDQIKEKEAYVGISVTTPTYQKGLEIARRLKQKSPGILTIIGGYHTKGQGRFIAQHPEVDYVVEGEGEKALVKILEGENNKIIFGEPLKSEELDSISIRDLLRLNPKYFKTLTQLERINYISTRGCPHSCSFCASSGILSTKSTERVADDLETLAKEEFNQISIQDNYFGYSPQRIREICNEILARKININWDCQTRVESMQESGLLRLMADAGCSAAYLGTENFHPEILNKMNKTKNPENYVKMARNAIKNMLNVGIRPYLNLQVGLVYENQEIRQTNIDSLREMGRLAKEYNTQIEIYLHLKVVYPGTSDFYALVQNGVPEDIFEKFTKWEEENGKEITDLLRENHFIHGAGGIPVGVLNIGSLKKGKFEIEKSKIKAVGEYIDRISAVDRVRTYK